MDGITLSFTDARPVLAPGALEEQVRAAAPLLAEAAAGEERYRDNLGWHSVDEAAGPERVDFLLEQGCTVTYPDIDEFKAYASNWYAEHPDVTADWDMDLYNRIQDAA